MVVKQCVCVLDRLINEAISFVLTLTYDDETQSGAKTNRASAKIVVSNCVSPFDGLILRKVSQATNAKVVQRDESCLNWFKLSSVNVVGNQEELFDACVRETQNAGSGSIGVCSKSHDRLVLDSQLIFLPECESTTGVNGLLKFK